MLALGSIHDMKKRTIITLIILLISIQACNKEHSTVEENKRLENELVTEVQGFISRVNTSNQFICNETFNYNIEITPSLTSPYFASVYLTFTSDFGRHRVHTHYYAYQNGRWILKGGESTSSEGSMCNDLANGYK